MEYREKLDKSILESLKGKIYYYLKSKGLKNADFIRSNMDKVENLYVEDSDTRHVNRMESRSATTKRPAEIMINKVFIEVDKNDKPVGIDKKMRKLISSQLGHELLHAGARYDGYTGILNTENNRGLNEGLTQMFTEKIFGYVVSPNGDLYYKDYKKMAKILDVTFGEAVTLDAYFNHSNALEKGCNKLSGDDNFYRSVNKTLTSMYNMKFSGFKKDNYYASLIENIYDEENELIYQKLCAQIVVPKLRTMTQKEQTKYLTQILENTKDDFAIEMGLKDKITNFGRMTSEQLDREIKRIDTKLKNVEEEYNLVKQLYSENDYNKLITVSDDDTIHSKSNEKIRIENKILQEKILSGLYFQDRKFTDNDNKKFEDRVVNKFKNLQSNNMIEFKAKGNTIEKKKTLSAIKYMAQRNGYLVLNSLEECEHADCIELNAIKEPTEKETLSFQDLKKIYELYEIDYEIDINNKGKMIVKNRHTNEKIDDLQLVKIAKFANIWAEAAGTKWIYNEKINGINYAFSETSEQMFNEISTLISNNMIENATINTKAIYDEISKEQYKYSEQIIDTLFKDPLKLEVVYNFYKMQTTNEKYETEISKPSSEFYGRVKSSEIIQYQANEIVRQISPTDITESTLRKKICKEEINSVTADIRREQTRDLKQTQQK